MEYVLTGSKCKSCGKVFFPKKRVCTNCLSIDNMEAENLSKRGKLVSYTINHVGMPGFDPPYAFGYVELPEGIWIYSTLKVKGSFDKLRIGMDVELAEVEGQEDEFGKTHLKWTFAPLS